MTDMWPFSKRGHLPPALSTAETRLEEAQEALRHTEQVKDEATRQVDFFQRLRAGWDRVHERNNLAALFTEEYRRTHGD